MPHQEGRGSGSVLQEHQETLAHTEQPTITGLVHAISHSDLQQPEQKKQRSDNTPDLGPLLQPLGPAEPLTSYFKRLGSMVECSAYVTCPSGFTAGPGLYVFKRPVRTVAGAPSILQGTGSVFHHVVLYLLTCDGKLSSLDYGPANGADVTANFLESCHPRGCINSAPLPDKSAPAEPTTSPANGSGDAEEVLQPGQPGALPLLYLGQPVMWVEDQRVKKALALAESRPYNILRNNCIHFADAMTRLLTGGAVRSAPLVYDLVAGQVPPVDPPVVLMAQAMLQLPWTCAVDGSSLYQAMVLGDKAPQVSDAAAGQLTAGTAPSPASAPAAPAPLANPAAMLSALLTALPAAAPAPAPVPSQMAGLQHGAALLGALLSAVQGRGAGAPGAALLPTVCLAGGVVGSQAPSGNSTGPGAINTAAGDSTVAATGVDEQTAAVAVGATQGAASAAVVPEVKATSAV